MPTFNARVAVVKLLEAASADEAVTLLRSQLLASGFDPYADDADAFESEPDGEETANQPTT